MTNKKQTGSYYTPGYISEFIWEQIIPNISDNDISILEPSVGDGSFISTMLSFTDFLCKNISIDILDINKSELEKAENKIKTTQINYSSTPANFLDFALKTEKNYNLIIGNPPYIKSRYLTEQQRSNAQKIQENAGLSNKKVKNIWTSFVIGSMQLLNEKGIMAFVLPVDLLQIKYATEIREHIEKSFERIDIITFNNPVFEDTDQATVILIAYKKSVTQGVFFAKFPEREDDKIKYSLNKLKNTKWTHNFLNQDEIKFINKLREKLPKVNDFCNSKAGIVTAANNYFILSKSKVEQYKLHELTKPIIQKGFYVNGGVTFSNEDFNELVNNNKPAFLLSLSDNLVLNSELKEYLEIGIENEIHKRFKCKQRKKWYVVPNVMKPTEGFFFKRSHLYPKLLKNEAQICITDAGYLVSMKFDYNIDSLIYSFYNSLTLLFAELDGRYYGGGVLELSPNEFKNLPLPYIMINKIDFERFSAEFRKKKDISQILNLSNRIILQQFGLSKVEIQTIERIRLNLLKRRIKKC